MPKVEDLVVQMMVNRTAAARETIPHPLLSMAPATMNYVMAFIDKHPQLADPAQRTAMMLETVAAGLWALAASVELDPTKLGPAERFELGTESILAYLGVRVRDLGVAWGVDQAQVETWAKDALTGKRGPYGG